MRKTVLDLGSTSSVRLQMRCCTPAWLRCKSCLNLMS